MITFPFLPHLGRAAPFPHGVEQLDPIAVRHAQYGRGRQKARGPRRVRLEEPRQAGALRHLGKQGQIIARQPAVEGASPSPFDGKQQSQSHDFTGIEVWPQGVSERPASPGPPCRTVR